MEQTATSSTMSGKFVNPTDQCMIVQAAVLKMKDPKQIIQDMEKLDEIEFNPVQQLQLNEKVLKDKHKKLCETSECILRLYEKENPDIYKKLSKIEVKYEKKRARLSQHFDAVKNVIMMMFLAPVKMMAILRTWIKVSMMTVVMTVTLKNQMEEVKEMNLCTVMMVRETTMKKRTQI
uniref:Uncharacterized protein n=1 Tax=Saimiri boliviensis boliviensis TaxID=39432 RepID=A0A2K6SJA3_SAIBB